MSDNIVNGIIYGPSTDTTTDLLTRRVKNLERKQRVQNSAQLALGSAAPPSPSLFAFSTPDNNMISFKFNVVDDPRVAAYNIYRAPSESMVEVAERVAVIPQVGDSASGSLMWEDSSPGASQKVYWVCSVNGMGVESPRILAKKYAGDGVAPSAVQNFTVTGSGGKFTAKWSPPASNISTLDDFVIQYATDSGFTSIVATVRLGLIYSIEGVDPGKTYYWRIAAHNLSGDTTTNTDANLTSYLPNGWGPWTNYGAPDAVSSGSITAVANIADRGWTYSGAFTTSAYNVVSWASGTFTSSDGTAYSITAGSKNPITAKTYVYLDTSVSTTAFQTTTTATTAVGLGKVMIAILEAGPSSGSEASWIMLNDNSFNLNASNIIAGSITTNEIAAGTITTGNLKADAIDGMTITGSTVQTAASGARVVLNSTGIHAYNSTPTELVTILNDGSFTLKSASTGQRIEIDGNGVRTYAAGGFLSAQVGVTGEVKTWYLVGLSLSGTESNYINLATSGVIKHLGSTNTEGIELNADGNTKTIKATGSKDLWIGSNSASAYVMIADLLKVVSTGILSYVHILPSSTTTYDLGSSSYKWHNGYIDHINCADIAVSGNVDGVDISAHAGASSSVHGTSGTVVGTSDAQTLTNKIIDSNATGKGVKVRHFTSSPTWANEAQGVFTSDISGVRRIGWYDGSHNFSITLPDTDVV